MLEKKRQEFKLQVVCCDEAMKSFPHSPRKLKIELLTPACHEARQKEVPRVQPLGWFPQDVKNTS